MFPLPFLSGIISKVPTDAELSGPGPPAVAANST